MSDKRGSYGFINEDALDPAPLILYDLGIERRQNETYFFDNTSRNNYTGYLFQYTLEGHGYFEQEKSNGIHEMEAGSAFLIPFPHPSKYYVSQKPEEHWTFFYLHFDGYLADQVVNKIIKNTGNCIHFSASPSFLHTFYQEYTEIRNGKQYERYEASGFLYQFLMQLLRETEVTGRQAVSAIEKGRQWISQNFTTPFSLSELCGTLQISLPHFSRQFHAMYGTTPLVFLNRLRLEYAISLLLNSSFSIQEIARKSGFAEGNYFSKVFRKYVGMSPTEYRENHL